MATPAQAAAATVGAGSLAAAGAYGITYATKSEDNHEEESDLSEHQKEILSEPRDVVTHVLASGTNLDNSYSGKVLDVTKKTNLDKLVKTNANEKWWDWAFKHKFSRKTEGQVDGVFGSVQKAFLASEAGSNNKTALNLACEEAYKKGKDEFNKENSHLVTNIGLFCTKGFNFVDISEPEATVLGDNGISTYTDKLGAKGNNKTKLVKIKVESSETTVYNDKWWDWVFKNRFPKEEAKKEQLASIFQKVIKGYLATETNNAGSKTSLNNACEEAYNKKRAELSGDNDKVLQNTKAFCTKLENEDLELPDN